MNVPAQQWVGRVVKPRISLQVVWNVNLNCHFVVLVRKCVVDPALRPTFDDMTFWPDLHFKGQPARRRAAAGLAGGRNLATQARRRWTGIDAPCMM